MNTTPIIIENVTLAYDADPVVNAANFDVNAGETFGLIGLNGAGKTTLIKSMLAMRSEKSGSISLFGTPSSAINARQSVAFLPERFEPPWFLTGEEFVAFSLKLYKAQFNKDVLYDYAEQLYLDTAALRRKVQTYSKGMRQKLGLIATLMTGCNLLILDEPMSGLDPLARVRVKDALNHHKKNNPDLTIFLSSHILSDMDEICDRVAILHDATIQFVGKPQSLKTKTKQKSLEHAFLHLINK